MKKQIAFIGSSGGNLYKQGGNDIAGMMKEILAQTKAADMEIAFVQYVLASGSLDTVGPESKASLYTWDGAAVCKTFEGTLQQVNEKAAEVDAALAEKVGQGEIDGIMFVSADPQGANAKTVQAAAAKKLPMAGTGGTGVALIQSLGCNVLSASGTTGTTNRTRAVAFTTALAKNWGIKYMPVIGNTGADAAGKISGNVVSRINFRGIMMTSLPAFIAMALLLACSKIPGCSSLSDVFDTLVGYIPVVVCAIAAKQVSGMDEVGVVADGLGRIYRDTVTGMDTGSFDMLHDTRDQDILAVAYGIDLDFLTDDIFIHQDRMLLCVTVDNTDVLGDIFIVNGNLHTLSAKYVRRTNQYRIAQLMCGIQGFVYSKYCTACGTLVSL